MSECRVVDLKELGVSKEVFDKIYSMGEQDGREDAIAELIKKDRECQGRVECQYIDSTIGCVECIVEQIKG